MVRVPTLQDLVSLAEESGSIARRHFTIGNKTQWKGDNTPLTLADQQINAHIVEAVEKNFPGVRVVAEEGNGGPEESEWTILADPVDGTKAFRSGMPTFTVILALVHENNPKMSVIHDPMLHGTWAADSTGAFLNKERINVSAHKTIDHAFITVDPPGTRQLISPLENAGASVCNLMSIAYCGGLVATGGLEGTVYQAVDGLETAAMHVLVEAAGGHASDINGKPLQYRWENDTLTVNGHIITNGHIHEELLRMVSGQ